MNFPVTLAAGEVRTFKAEGLFFGMLSCDLQLQVAFNGGAFEPVNTGQVIPYASGIEHLSIKNTNAVVVNCEFYVDDKVTAYVPADNTARIPDTYLVGNLGVLIGAAAAGGKPECDGDGYLKVLNGTNYNVPGTNNGRRRQNIIFTTKTNALQIKLTATGNALNIPNGTVMPIPTSADFIIQGIAGTALVTILETYPTKG